MAKFYLDHNVARQVAGHLTANGHTVLTTQNNGMERAPDDQQLLFAADHGLILVSHNARDFLLLHDAWHHWSPAWGVHREHAGILLIPNSTPHLTYEWLAQRLSEAVALQLPLMNELYRWRTNRGWIRQ